MSKFIKTKIQDFLGEDFNNQINNPNSINSRKEKKYFAVTDKTGRSDRPYKLDKTHIEEHWDLEEVDWDTEEALGDFLEDCYIGDTWNTRTEKFECIAIM